MENWNLLRSCKFLHDYFFHSDLMKVFRIFNICLCLDIDYRIIYYSYISYY